MSFITLKKQQKKEKIEKQMKRDAEVEVDNTMMTLVDCLWVSSSEYQERSKETKCKEPTPENRKRLIRKAATMLKKSYKHSRDDMGCHKQYVKYQLLCVQQYIDNPEMGDCWDGMDNYDSDDDSDFDDEEYDKNTKKAFMKTLQASSKK